MEEIDLERDGTARAGLENLISEATLVDEAVVLPFCFLSTAFSFSIP